MYDGQTETVRKWAEMSPGLEISRTLELIGKVRHLYTGTASFNWILSGAVRCWRSGVMWSYLEKENTSSWPTGAAEC